MLTYSVWLRNHCIRSPEHLTNPPISPISGLILPRSSVFHHTSDNQLLLGLNGDDIVLQNRDVLLEHISTLASEVGNPKPVTGAVPEALAKPYFRKNRKIKRLTSHRILEQDTSNDTLVVEDYSLLPQLYRYTAGFFAEYHRWFNIQATQTERIRELLKTSTRQHFVRLELPTPLPTRTQLSLYEDERTKNTITPIYNHHTLNLVDLYAWAGKQPEISTWGAMSPEEMDRTTVILTFKGKWTAFNMGILNSWILRPDVEAKGRRLTPDVMQRQLMRVVMALWESGSAVGDDDIGIPLGRRDLEEERVRRAESMAQLKESALHELETGDTLDLLTQDQDTIDADLDALNQRIDTTPVKEITTKKLLESKAITDYSHQIRNKIDELADQGSISGGEYRRLSSLADSFKSVVNPYTQDGTVEDLLKIDKSDLKITPEELPVLSGLTDPSLAKTTVTKMDRQYVEKVIRKDTAGMLAKIQHAGFIITNWQVNPVVDAMNDYEVHSVSITPASGKSSTLHFRLPRIQKDGSYLAGGIKYRMRKQRGDVPIRKTAPDTVALTSYYGKVFVTRSEKSTHNYTRWLNNAVSAIAWDDNDHRVTNARAGKAYNQESKVPKIYSVLGQRFQTITIGTIDVNLDYAKRFEIYGAEEVKKAERGDYTVIGKDTKTKSLVVVDESSIWYTLTPKGPQQLGKLEDILGLSVDKAPIEQVDLDIYSKSVPLGLVLGYYLGLEQLLKLLKPNTHRVVPAGDRLHLQPGEYAIRFSNLSIVLNRDDRLTSMLMSGFLGSSKWIRSYSSYDFDSPQIYLNLLESLGLGISHLRELDSIKDLFVDPITHELLAEMKEPTEWVGLLWRSAELLLTDYSPEETDMRYMRIKGYERIPGAMYSELVRVTRNFNARRGSANNKLDLPPNKIWVAIQEDGSKVTVEESNPVHNLREKEAVTFTGTGGRSRRSMVGRVRKFHPNDLGVISESTVDSSDVAINTYLSANPNFNSVRGTVDVKSVDDLDPASIFSTPTMLSPSADKDDPKRVNFIGIQHSSSMAAEGYTVLPYRTGYERVVAHRTDDLYATTAKANGVVKTSTKDAIVVEYEDGTTDNVKLGRRFGVAAGTIHPHEVITKHKAGDKITKGEWVAYNPAFFAPDPSSEKELIWKAGMLVRTAIVDNPSTFEDSSVISEAMAEKMATKVTKVKEVVLRFDQSVRNIVPIGASITPDTILMTIEDTTTSNSELFSKESLDLLRLLAGQTPRAGVKGVVEKIEMFYNGELEDMSDSLRKVAQAADRNLSNELRDQGRPTHTGQVDSSLRISGVPLNLDYAVIKIYITSRVTAGTGDKGVFGNQLKTIISRVMSGKNTTEDGVPIDGMFSYVSIGNRIALSPEDLGTTNTLCIVYGRDFVTKAYDTGVVPKINVDIDVTLNKAELWTPRTF